MTAGRAAQDFVRDILAATEKAIAFVGDMTLEAFEQDDRTLFAVTRALEIVGEAAKRIPDDIRSRFPAVPWAPHGGYA